MISISCKFLIPWNQEINQTNYSSQLTLIFLKLKNKGLNLSQCLIGRSSHINSKDRTTFHIPIITTHSPLEILPEKHILKLVEEFSGHWRAIKS